MKLEFIKRKVNRILLVVSMIAIAMPLAAYDFMVDGICYDIYPDGKSVKVTYEKNNDFDWEKPTYDNVTGLLTIPSTVAYNGITYKVVGIGEYAFSNCSGITDIVIPSDLTNIGLSAFDGTGWFNNQSDGMVYIGNVVYKYKGIVPNGASLAIQDGIKGIAGEAFSGCSGFTGSLTIPNSVTSIGVGAFSDCSGFTGLLTIPNSVTSIGFAAFRGCSGITDIIIPSDLAVVGGSVFDGTGWYDNQPDGVLYLGNVVLGHKGPLRYGTTLTLRDGIKGIADIAFAWCTEFTGSLTIPNTVTTIGEAAFAFCGGFKGPLTLGSSLKYIGPSAFLECHFTGSLTIPNTVSVIGSEAFSGCGFSGPISIPDSVTFIAASAFENCDGLTGSLILPKHTTAIGSDAFRNCSGFTGPLSIPNSVASIGDRAFYGCSGFTGSLMVPNTVTAIGESAFQNCSSLAGSLTISNSVTTIGSSAFDGCSGLSSLMLTGDGEFKLSSSAALSMSMVYIQSGIRGIKGLRLNPNNRVYAFSTTPPECDENTFMRYAAALHVPKRLLAAYIDAPYWSNFGNISADAVEPEVLEWEHESVVLRLGEELSLESPLIPDNTGLDVEIVSSNTEVVRVLRRYDYNTGRYTYAIKGLKAGEADIIATCLWLESGLHVTVTEGVVAITLDKHEVELKVGSLVALTPSSSPVPVEYAVKSSDSSVAIARLVDGRIQVEGVKPGVAVITVSDVEGKAVPDTCRVTVTKISITLDKHEVEVEAGSMVTLTPTAPAPLEFVVESSDRSVAVARVMNGRVQVVGAKPGVAVITVSDVDGRATPDTCRVTVIRPVGDITGDGYVDIDDVNVLINIIVRKAVLADWPMADVDGNSIVDIDDLNHVINIMLHKE